MNNIDRDIKIKKDNDKQYTITIHEFLNGEEMYEPYDIHLKCIDGYWVFEEWLCRMGDPLTINVIGDNDEVVFSKEYR